MPFLYTTMTCRMIWRVGLIYKRGNFMHEKVFMGSKKELKLCHVCHRKNFSLKIQRFNYIFSVKSSSSWLISFTTHIYTLQHHAYLTLILRRQIWLCIILIHKPLSEVKLWQNTILKLQWKKKHFKETKKDENSPLWLLEV